MAKPNGNRRSAPPIVTALACLGTLCAQAPALGDAEHVVLEVHTLKRGEEVARIAEPKPGEQPLAAFTLQGRELAWRVGERRVEDRAALAAELERLAQRPSFSRADPGNPGSKVQLPVVVKLDESACWRDAVDAVESLLAAGIVDIECVQSSAPFRPRWLPKSSTQAVRGNGASVVPRAVYNEPDDQAPAWRPTVYVLQDGRVEIGGATVFHPRKADGGKSLRAALQRAALAVRDKGSKRFRGDCEVLETPLLIHADQWAPWSSVHLAARTATEIRPAFHELDYAVAEHDYEARMRAGERFPDPPAGDSNPRGKR